MSLSSQNEETRRHCNFATTLWTVVLEAGAGQADIRESALEKLCQTYWYPIYAHVRRRGYSSHDAQDLTQGFFASLLNHAAFDSLSREKGRFRSYLLCALGNYLSDRYDFQNAAKRGGNKVIVSMDEESAEERYQFEGPKGDSPEREFDRRWAISVMESALDILAREQQQAGKGHVFARVRPFLLDAAESGDYNAAAIDLMVPANTIAATVRRLRQRYREIVREEISRTLLHPEDIEREMNCLLEAMRS